ncbi:hypothetical protein NQZ68_004538 [Dissostichus eleginoides]|nr:hypothetical protein NQZ68_004538 [Dissostichus eleginoides]
MQAAREERQEQAEGGRKREPSLGWDHLRRLLCWEIMRAHKAVLGGGQGHRGIPPSGELLAEQRKHLGPGLGHASFDEAILSLKNLQTSANSQPKVKKGTEGQGEQRRTDCWVNLCFSSRSLNWRAVVVPCDTDKVCDQKDDPEDEPTFLRSTLPLSPISTMQTPSHHEPNAQHLPSANQPHCPWWWPEETLSLRDRISQTPRCVLAASPGAPTGQAQQGPLAAGGLPGGQIAPVLRQAFVGCTAALEQELLVGDGWMDGSSEEEEGKGWAENKATPFKIPARGVILHLTPFPLFITLHLSSPCEEGKEHDDRQAEGAGCVIEQQAGLQPSSQLGRSCPNRRPWEKMRRKKGGLRKEAQGGSGEGGGLGKGRVELPLWVGNRTRTLSKPPPPHPFAVNPWVTRWPSVGACQGLCGLPKAVQRFPFPGALSAPAWFQRTVFTSCVIADLSLSRRPASVKIAMCSLQARLKSHQLLQSGRVSHNPLPD